MTTIAYKDGIVAYDSRVSADNLIQDDSYDKHIENQGTHFFMCGSTEDWHEYVESFCSNKNPTRDLDVSALVLHEGNLFKSSVTKEGDGFRIWKSPIRLESICAIGSGRDFAIMAMDLGHSAKKAIETTANRDMWTGGLIREFKLNDSA